MAFLRSLYAPPLPLYLRYGHINVSATALATPLRGCLRTQTAPQGRKPLLTENGNKWKSPLHAVQGAYTRYINHKIPPFQQSLTNMEIIYSVNNNTKYS